MIEDKPLVSVVMITYGHEKYIEQAINGVLIQECDFEVELIISNDCSPDGTDAIVNEILQKQKNKKTKIKYHSHLQNKGMMGNSIWSLNQCEGKYVALCEGDDYWTDSLKLQKQVDFLENNNNYVLVATGIDELMDGKIRNCDWRWDKSRVTFSVKDYLYQLFFHTSTVMYRKIELPSFLNDNQITQGDIGIFLCVLSKGPMYYMTESTSVYRRHEGGISNSVTNRKAENRLKSMQIICNGVNDFTNKSFALELKLKMKIEKYICKMNSTENVKINQFLYRFYKSLLLIIIKLNK